MDPRPRTAFAFVADLAGSREASGRAALARRLERTLVRLASEWKEQWIAAPVTTRGLDEISAVLRTPERAFDLLVALDETVHPLRFRAAIAEGTLDVAVATRDAADMDGPAFHRAADALHRAEREELPLAVELDGLDAPAQRTLEQALRLHRALAEDWTDARARTVAAFRRLGVQAAVAQELGVTPQTVSEALAAAHAHAALGLEAAAREWLADFGR